MKPSDSSQGNQVRGSGLVSPSPLGTKYPADKPSSGSQDSIDEILLEHRQLVMDETAKALRDKRYAIKLRDSPDGFMSELCDSKAKERLTAWHNTQLKASQVRWIDNFLLAWSGDMPFEVLDSMRSQRDELRANLEKL